MFKRIFLSAFFLFPYLSYGWGPLTPLALASNANERNISLTVDATFAKKGFSLSSSDSLAQLIVGKNVLHGETTIDLKEIEATEMQDTFLPSLKIVGNVYLFDIVKKKSYDGAKDLLIDVADGSSIDKAFPLRGRRALYFYNGVHAGWEQLPSVDDPLTSTVHAHIRLPFARVAVFEESVPSFGRASWYRFRGCDCAASPDYPKGTKLRVTNIDDPKKVVIVKVNDFGPERDIMPDRIIDLDRVAFEKLARTSAGVIRVRVEPVPKKEVKTLPAGRQDSRSQEVLN